MTEQAFATEYCDFCYGTAMCKAERERYLLLYFPCAGNALQIGDVTACVPCGSLFLFSPEAAVSLAEPGEPFFSISFAPQALVQESREILASLCAPHFSCEGIPASALRCLLRFEEVLTLKDAQRQTLLKLLLSELLLHIGGTVKTEPLTEPKLGLRARHYIDAHLTAPLSLEELAKQFFVSKYYLCRVFKAQCKLPVGQYIRKKRIELAATLMQSGETASSAAFCAGFGDYSTFYRAYKKISGKSPMENA